MTTALTPEQKKAKIESKRNEALYGPKGEPTAEGLQIRKASDRPQRQVRGVFNGTQGKMKIPESVVQAFSEAGWHLHIFNDQDGRIEKALMGGYEFVTKDEVGSTITNVVSSNKDVSGRVAFHAGTNDKGDGFVAYLMKIPQADYEEEQHSIQARVDRVDQAIRSGKNLADGGSSDGFYDAGISLKN